MLNLQTSLITMKTAATLLKGLPLTPADAARLALEMAEALNGGIRASASKGELMERFRQVIRAGVQAMREAEKTVSFEQAAWASVEARSGLRDVSRRDLRNFARRMLRVPGAASRPLRAMKTQECGKLLESAFSGSPSSYRKGRAILHSIFRFGQQQGWCDGNPVARIAPPRVIERPIRPLALPEIRRLEEAAERPEHRDMKLALHLMLYCGIRPTEVKRLAPEDIQWRERRVVIRPGASKTGGGRAVPLRKASRLKGAPRLIPSNWRARWHALRLAAGFDHWQPDALRHTFASYHAQHFKNLQALQWEMGHRSTELLRTRYVGVVQGKAADFWK